MIPQIQKFNLYTEYITAELTGDGWRYVHREPAPSASQVEAIRIIARGGLTARLLQSRIVISAESYQGAGNTFQVKIACGPLEAFLDQEVQINAYPLKCRDSLVIHAPELNANLGGYQRCFLRVTKSEQLPDAAHG